MSDHAELFRGLAPTVSYGDRSFPSPEQYRRQVIRHSGIKAGDFSELCIAAQRDWHVRGQTGCQFARLAALQAHSLRWDTLVIPDPVALPDVDARLRAAVTSADIEIMSLLFPTIADGVIAAVVIRSLVDRFDFWLERDEVSGEMLHLGLRYPVGYDGIPAWVMAFAPFGFMPNTRRGPYFELAIRVKDKPESIFHRLNQDRGVAHLADAPLSMSAKHWEHRWESTLRRTRMILGGEPDEVSAAKTTLSIPVSQLSFARD